MRRIILAGSFFFVASGCDFGFPGGCPEGEEPRPVAFKSGVFRKVEESFDPPEAEEEGAVAAFSRPGKVETMEVDRKAGLVTVRGKTDEGKEFVETWRILK